MPVLLSLVQLVSITGIDNGMQYSGWFVDKMTPIELPAKPRVLIADDSRIVRATLIKRIEGLFEFREALDGEEAWETVLIDPTIRVVITDLTMPKLDGYGLLKRIRTSKISRIRNLPVVVVSGSDEHEERDRAKAAGATDLITKGIGTAQLLSRLDILSKLVNTQREFERSLETMVPQEPVNAKPAVVLPSVPQALAQAASMLDHAVKQHRNFVLLNLCVGLKHIGLEGYPLTPPTSVVAAVGQLLQSTLRQTDYAAQTGEAEFTLVTNNIHSDSAQDFAKRICHVVTSAHLIKDERISFVASCGLVFWSDAVDQTGGMPVLADLRATAQARGALGMGHALSGPVGPEEEAAFKNDANDSMVTPRLSEVGEVGVGDSHETTSPDLSVLLQWAKDGKRDQVLQHLDKFSAELQPLLDLMLQQRNP